MQPEEYARIDPAQLDKRGPDQDAEYIERVDDRAATALADGRHRGARSPAASKHIYSIYRKMQRKKRAFDEIYDVIGIRDHRRRAEATATARSASSTPLWHPIPGEFDDYIATPKESMYQSLHTAVIGPEGHALEIQIRTREMHQIAEYGVAAHWRYKEGTQERRQASKPRSPGCAS